MRARNNVAAKERMGRISNLFLFSASITFLCVPRYFEWNKLAAKARNPKPEIRKKPEGRSPKKASSCSSDGRTHSSPPLKGRPVLRSTPTKIAVRSGATAEGGPARISDFGFLSDFGFRPSDFLRAPFH